jgi:hypothetical protein
MPFLGIPELPLCLYLARNIAGNAPRVYELAIVEQYTRINNSVLDRSVLTAEAGRERTECFAAAKA